MADAPEGIQLAHTLFGVPKDDVSPTFAHGDVQPNPWGVPYAGPRAGREKKCIANNDTCNGWRISGSSYCPAHSGLLRNVPAVEDEVSGEPG